MNKGGGRIRIGTSGWHFRHWEEAFYPENLPAGRWLDCYRRHFSTAEINHSFYRLPREETLANWSAELIPTFAIQPQKQLFSGGQLTEVIVRQQPDFSKRL